jgi:transposase
MMLIGIDPHKSTHTATVVDPETNRDHASIRIDVTLDMTLREYQRMLAWAGRWPQRRWAVENARGMGCHVTSWLLARGEQVVDVSPAAIARVRQLSRGGGRKTDRIDAAAAACVAALHGDARPVHPEDTTDALALLDERRTNLAQARVRAVNQLHALLRALLPGGAPRDLSASKAAELLNTVHPAGTAERTRHHLATDLVAEVRSWDAKLKDNAKAMAELVAQSASTLTNTPGIGAITAARLIGRTGRPSRFANASAFAHYTGTAPVEIASAERTRHRLSRGGDRQLNSALHTIAITQIRMPGSLGHTYYQRTTSANSPKAKHLAKRNAA